MQDIIDQAKLIPQLVQPTMPPTPGIVDSTTEITTETGTAVENTATQSLNIKQNAGYAQQVAMAPENADLVRKITEHVRSAMRQAADYQSSLEANYSIYWGEDRKEFIRQFCRYGRLLTKDDLGPTGEIELPENPPTLEQFREQILKYDRVYEEVERIEDTRLFDSWLKADLKPFKQSLLAVIRQWSDKFKQYLVDHVTSTLNGLSLFIDDSTTDLKLEGEAEEVGYNKLVTVLERLKLIREAEDATDAGFEPLRETVAMLKEFGEELPDAMTKLLEFLPEQWHELKNVAILTKQKVQPLQEQEVQNIRLMSQRYDQDSARLRSEFSEADVFLFNCEEPYIVLDQVSPLNVIASMQS
ncbi:unnamed protein product [Protopolystoma xenopodis]|uniref:Dynein heavy chain linker domain-containing protein n=1 Tax=Protopolystoma xenopodis TaxID=117903 RepID=A0A3S5CDS6_9PLAT|nr:unnamed protein product [Protopolystoma xenopodis]